MRARTAVSALALSAMVGAGLACVPSPANASWFRHHPSPSPSPTASQMTPSSPPPAGVLGAWTLDWSDEFSGSSVDASKWNVAGHAPGSATNCYDAAHVSESGGALHLLAEKRTTTCAAGTVTRDYVSGSVSAKQTFTSGVFEARVYVPAAGNGQVANWPAWWLVAWPSVGEIDVWEGLGSAGGCWSVHPEPVDPGGCVAPTTGWHTFGARWVNGVGVDVYYDGVKRATVPYTATSAEYPVLDNATATWVTTAVPSDLQVDYVRHWH